MKKLISITSILIISLFLTMPVFADTGAPGSPPGEPSGAPPIGGGAPIGGGSLILLGMAAAYGGRKVYLMNKEEREE